MIRLAVSPSRRMLWKTFEVDGIAYFITDSESKTVKVTYSYTRYSGDIEIPSTVTYDNVTYDVTSIGEDA